MRNLLIAATAAAAVSAMPTRPADACGSYTPEPQVMMVSSHQLLHTDGRARRRAFIILGEAAPEGLAWTRLAPGTYDGTQIASAPLLAEAAELTLVGPSGTRIVKLRKQVYLAAAWRWSQPMVALEVELGPRDDFRAALWGAQPAAARRYQAIAASLARATAS